MGRVAALIFYRRLFETAPDTRRLFRADIEEQSRKLIEHLRTALSLAQSPTEFHRRLEQFGAQLVLHGARPEHCPIATGALMEMLAAVLGAEFTPALRWLWVGFLESIAASILAGAVNPEERSIDTPPA